MNEKRVYIDTSIIGGKFDSEFQKPTIKFFEKVNDKQFRLVISTLVQQEILAAPEHIKHFYNIVKKNADLIDVTKSALKLREAYLRANIVTEKSSNDALHVAIATVNNCPIILSWNFKHIVHYEKIILYNAINILEGYQQISIHSPLEVIDYE